MKWLFLLLFVAAPALGADSDAVDTTIKGGRMELLNKGESVLFTGGVNLVRGGDQLKASQMRTNRRRDNVAAKGDVKLFRRVSSTETWQAFGENGTYDTTTGSGTLLGSRLKKAHVIHTEIISSTMSRIVNLSADRIEFYRENKRAVASGSVRGDTTDPSNGERFDFWSDHADFDGEADQITLTGAVQPIVIQTTAAGRRTLTGDKIVYYTEQKRLRSEGKARAVFEDDKSKRKKK